VKLLTDPVAASAPVDKPVSSPGCTHSETALLKPEHGVFPVLHTLYYYDKGNL
jgi:hypothetical protein